MAFTYVFTLKKYIYYRPPESLKNDAHIQTADKKPHMHQSTGSMRENINI